MGRPGPYQIQAAIQAVHSDASTAADTDWGQIVTLYRQLEALAPSPVVTLNRAVAEAELAGPAAGLALLDGLPWTPIRPSTPCAPSSRPAPGTRSRRSHEFTRAADLTTNPVEEAHLRRRAAELR